MGNIISGCTTQHKSLHQPYIESQINTPKLCLCAAMNSFSLLDRIDLRIAIVLFQQQRIENRVAKFFICHRESTRWASTQKVGQHIKCPTCSCRTDAFLHRVCIVDSGIHTDTLGQLLLEAHLSSVLFKTTIRENAVFIKMRERQCILSFLASTRDTEVVTLRPCRFESFFLPVYSCNIVIISY